MSMATEWGGWTRNGALAAFRRPTGPGPGETDRERASGATTKIRSRWEGGYWDKYGCTGKGGGGGGADRDKHQDDQGVSRALKIRLLVWSVWQDALRTSRPSGGHRLLRASTYTRSKYHQPHRSGGQTPKHRDTGQDTRGSMAPAASQFRADSG